MLGQGLAALRLFINGMIKKMKGKHIGIKIGFFAALLSVGLPFQNWFRTDVILSMSKTYIVPSVVVMERCANDSCVWRDLSTCACTVFGRNRSGSSIT